MGNWTEHGNSWYSCNRYEEKESTDARDAQSKSRASLERYLHVCLSIAYYVFAGADYVSSLLFKSWFHIYALYTFLPLRIIRSK